MIFSKNFSGNRHFLTICLLSAVLSGCAVAPVTGPGGERTPLPLAIGSVSPDKGSPQAAEMATVRWQVEAKGGVGKRTYAFFVADEKEEKVAQESESASWAWAPSAPGTYRVRVVVRDAIGNAVESGWSQEYTVVPKLMVSSLLPDKGSPQAAEMATVRWNVEAQGGVGERTFAFRLSDGKTEMAAQEGPSALWAWAPTTAGTYRVKAVVRDALGNAAESGWSQEYTVAPKLEVSSPVSNKKSPQAAMMATVRWSVEAKGGVGKRTYAFLVADGKEEKVAQEGESASWVWAPSAPGTYRVRVAVRDAIGNAVENGWSQEYTVVPKLMVSSLLPDKGSPQAAEMATVRWNVEAQGGVGERTFAFRLSDGKTEMAAQEGPSALWAWSPKTPGTYRVKAVVRDALGNAAESGWSQEYMVAPKLEVSSVTTDKASPQAAEMATVRWKVIATGGVGSYRYEFRTTDGQVEKAEQTGALPTWDWSPKVPGTYRVKVVVRDAIGNAADNGWSSPYLVAPPLVASLLSPDPVSPQVAGMAKVRWKVDTTGGVGNRTIEFRTTDGKEEKREQGGTSQLWDWSPQAPGTHKVKAVVRDEIGNAVDSGWSPEYLVVPKLRIISASPDKFPPQAAAVSTVRWRVNAAGGVGEREYSFWISDGTLERAEQKGFSPTWDWSPGDPGIYRVKGIVRDAIGNVVESGWSPEYRIELTAGLNSLIAVMPVENLTGMPVAVHAVRRSLAQDLRRKGLNILGEEALEKFLERHRVRYTGGLNRELGEALREETGTDGVLFPTLELSDDAVPPKIALIARLISTHRNADILWVDSTGMAGNDAPGFLLLGLIDDPALLWEKARERVTGSLLEYLSGKTTRDARTVERRFLPKSFHGVPPKVAAGKETLSIAVLPFRNESTRRNAGEIMALHFIRELSRTGNIDVVEPGEVRQVLLRSRTIMEGGLSLPQADLLHDALGVDLVFTGIVMEYQDNIGGVGNPKVEFSARVFDMKTRQIVWSSASHNEGDDGVFFFNLGKVNTAHGMASGMVRAAVRKMEAAFKPGEDHPAAANPSGVR